LVYGLGYPAGALMALFIVARSTWRGARRVEWRGRVYGRAATDPDHNQDVPLD